ncbi:MAG: hypothetical protein SVR94_03425 [Pseudomonadota bacterium]|nr:hypothetical protein [Pseudomonadota bacterium]
MTTLCDTMVHINDNLNLEQKQALEEKMRQIPGVIAPRFNKDHLLSISYNSDNLQAQTLLTTVQQQGYQAQLVGL